jgi:hypothetical protein
MSDAFIACPWCGDAPKGLNYRAQDGMKWAAGHCPHCEASTPPVRTNYKFEGRQPWMDEADAEWNRRASGWISVKDRLPEEGDNVLACLDGKFISSTFRKGSFFADSCDFFMIECDDSCCAIYEDFYSDNVTHWMQIPLPSAPEVEK